MKRDCGTCAWREDNMVGSWSCFAMPQPREEPSGPCALWKPKDRGWHTEACGTCEFRVGDECRKRIVTVGGVTNGEFAVKYGHDLACAEWMPEREE